MCAFHHGGAISQTDDRSPRLRDVDVTEQKQQQLPRTGEKQPVCAVRNRSWEKDTACIAKTGVGGIWDMCGGSVRIRAQNKSNHTNDRNRRNST